MTKEDIYEELMIINLEIEELYHKGIYEQEDIAFKNAMKLALENKLIKEYNENINT